MKDPHCRVRGEAKSRRFYTGRIMNTVVLVGAGASFDCASLAAPVDDRWRPPLTKDLFSGFHRPEFASILTKYPGAVVLAPDLAEKAKKSTFSLEAELRRLTDHSDPRIQAHCMDVPRYLEDLLSQVSHQYTAVPGAYLRLVTEILGECGHATTFISLNYDNLLEQALTRFDKNHDYDSIDDYCREGRQAFVVKPHGSIGWKLRVGYEQLDAYPGMERVVLPKKPWQILIDHGIPIGRPQLYPAITVPMASKSSTDLVCPEQHLSALRTRCAVAARLLIVGSSCLDEGILRVLQQSLPSNILITLVGTGDLEDVANRVKSVFTIREPYFEVFDQGFRSFLDSDRFHWFCRGQR